MAVIASAGLILAAGVLNHYGFNTAGYVVAGAGAGSR